MPSKIERCPHCSVASPAWDRIFSGNQDKSGPRIGHYAYALHLCRTCKRPVLQLFHYRGTGNGIRQQLIAAFPENRAVDASLPEAAGRFLQQAVDTLHAPDGSMMLSASAIDAMLKDKGYKSGTLHKRIEQATDDGQLIAELADWAHGIRLDANAVRHADDEFEETSPEAAKQAVEFAKTLGELWYGLPAKIRAKREASKK